MEIEVLIPIYKVKIRIILCDNVQQYFIDTFNLECSPCRAKLLDYLEEDDKNYDFILLLNKNDLCEEVLNHEAFHITYRTLRNAGITLSNDSEEAFAYLNDYIYILLRKRTIKWKSEQNFINNGNTNSSEEIRKTTIGTTTMEN